MYHKSIFFFLLFSFSISSAQETETKDFTGSIARGSVVYEDFCMQCHLPTGEGVASVYPPLAASDYLKKFPKKSLLAVKFGMKGKIVVNGETYDSMMPNPGLTDEEVADVMNYINSNWKNKNKMVTEEEVAKLEQKE